MKLMKMNMHKLNEQTFVVESLDNFGINSSSNCGFCNLANLSMCVNCLNLYTLFSFACFRGEGAGSGFGLIR